MTKTNPSKALKVVNPKQAWTEGARVWVLPATANSDWCKKIDWLLNFQISKATSFKTQELNKDFLASLSQLGLELDWKEESFAPLNMILTQGRLPCEAVVVMPQAISKKNVLKQTLKAIESLKRPTIRVFPASENQENWPTQADFKTDFPNELLDSVEVVQSNS